MPYTVHAANLSGSSCLRIEYELESRTMAWVLVNCTTMTSKWGTLLHFTLNTTKNLKNILNLKNTMLKMF